MKKAVVTVLQNGVETAFRAEVGALLSTVLHRHGAPLDLPCGGKGACKGCFVWVDGQKRLACQTVVQGDIRVELRDPAQFRQIEAGTLAPTPATDPMFSRYGIAIDIGTTTISASLLDDGGRSSTSTRKNPQTSFGADVISRIEKALSGELQQLSQCIRHALGEMIGELCISHSISPHLVDAVVITGNTAMLYFLAGQHPKALSHAPFQADRLFGEWVDAKTLELPISPGAKVYLPRCMSAFVGGDITTAVTASGICNRDQTALLVDMGTNGEIVLWHRGALTCCSTAAGPAFEGAGITHGVYGIGGAIDRVWREDGGIRCSTIGGGRAVGICGSGIVDSLAVMLELGVVDETGAFTGAGDFFELQDGIGITGEDVRNIQLAKSSIRAGIETLLSISGVDASQVELLSIAGGFGRYLNLESAARIGLIPEELLGQSQSIGNAAHTGASLLLQQQGLVKVSEEMARQARTVALAANSAFAENFVRFMLFE